MAISKRQHLALNQAGFITRDSRFGHVLVFVASPDGQREIGYLTKHDASGSYDPPKIDEAYRSRVGQILFWNT